MARCYAPPVRHKWQNTSATLKHLDPVTQIPELSEKFGNEIKWLHVPSQIGIKGGQADDLTDMEWRWSPLLFGRISVHSTPGRTSSPPPPPPQDEESLLVPQFFNLFKINLHDLPQINNTHIYRKKNSIPPPNLHTPPQKKITQLTVKKLCDLIIFFYKSYIFHLSKSRLCHERLTQ